MELRAWIVLTIFATLFAGCKRDSLNHPNKVVRQWADHQLNPIPPGEYDALFECYDASWYDKDSLSHQFCANVSFPVEVYRKYHVSKGTTIPPTMSVRLNGNPVPRGFNDKISLNSPQALTWQFRGDKRYPSVMHTIVADSAIEFFTPNDGESVSLSHGFKVRYLAPKSVDSAQFHLSYFGKGILKHDTTKIQETGQSYYYVVPNTGRYIVQPFALFPYFKSFDPKRFFVQIMSAHGDTVHLEDRVYGFVTESGTSRNFKLKP